MPTGGKDIAGFIQGQRGVAADRLVIGMALLGIVAVPFSVWRAIYTGWQLPYSVQCLAVICVALAAFFRSKLTATQKAGIVLTWVVLVAFTGLYEYGLFSNGELWMMLGLLLSMFFFDKKVTVALAIATLAIFIFTGYQFVFDGKLFPGDADMYLAQLPSWATVLFGSVMFVILVASIIVSQQDQTDELLLLLEKQNHEITHLANYDSLTDLPVRRLFVKSLEAALSQQVRENRFVAVGFIDLDGFKPINDTYGHDAGDYVLKSVAQRITTAIRAHEVAARVGGDEYVVLVSSPTESDLDELCKRLIGVIREPHNFKGEPLQVGASIGVARSRGEGETAEGLLKRADEAMYQVKHSGKNDFLIV